MKDPRVDAYIKRMQPFAQPILTKLREIIHKACPDVTETIKWGAPAFEYEGPICIIAGFKQHCVLAFNKGELLNDPLGYLREQKNRGGEAMGQLGRIESVRDIPPVKVMTDFVGQAVRLNEAGVKVKKKIVTEKELIVPDILMKALSKSRKAKAAFDSFSPSGKKEYAQWITDAKTDATREKRTATAIEWLSEGKRLNWKYNNK